MLHFWGAIPPRAQIGLLLCYPQAPWLQKSHLSQQQILRQTIQHLPHVDADEQCTPLLQQKILRSVTPNRLPYLVLYRYELAQTSHNLVNETQPA